MSEGTVPSEWKFEGRGLLSPEDLAKRAKEELNEDPKRRENDIKAIRDWFKKEPHLKGIPIGNERYCDHPQSKFFFPFRMF